MASKIDIANQALARIGAQTITDLEDTSSPTARIINNVFEQSVRELVRMHPWNCLKARQELAQLATPPSFEWDYQYQLPTDCVRLIKVNGMEPTDNESYFEVEGRKILMDDESCQITYIRYTEETGDYDPLFVEALVVYIASKIAISIRQDEQLSTAMLDMFQRRILPEARKVDGNENRRRRVATYKDSDWVRSRIRSTK
jgi:hypothetical protein